MRSTLKGGQGCHVFGHFLSIPNSPCTPCSRCRDCESANSSPRPLGPWRLLGPVSGRHLGEFMSKRKGNFFILICLLHQDYHMNRCTVSEGFFVTEVCCPFQPLALLALSLSCPSEAPRATRSSSKKGREGRRGLPWAGGLPRAGGQMWGLARVYAHEPLESPVWCLPSQCSNAHSTDLKSLS